MNDAKLTVAYLTAGAAGMFCGSCMRDNTLAAALTRLGVDVQLIPTYTPIRTDEENVSVDHVLFGGVNVYLQERYVLFRRLPRWLDSMLNSAWLINTFAGRGIEINAARLGALTVSMLQGRHGHQRKEVERLVEWLKTHHRPHLVNLSNMLIAGCVPAIKEELGVPVLVTLQGDDIFWNSLVEPYKQQVFAELRRLIAEIDGFIVFSRYYAETMGEMLGIPQERFRIVQMGVDLRGFEQYNAPDIRPPTVGYLARLAPEKGLHQLVDAFLLLKQMPQMESARLRIAGWLGKDNSCYAEAQFKRLRDAHGDACFEYLGTVDRQQKLALLQSIDVLSVPTVYREPKGIFVLEALAAGVPVVQPAHGAFPELLQATGGGKLVAPGDAQELAETLHAMLIDRDARLQLGLAGRDSVHRRFHAQAMAEATLKVYREFLSPPARR
jgi:glycosyltransferase involved in cell wall biosynthesis